MTGPMASIDDSDESLMSLIRQGSHQAFSILVRRHTDRFYASAFRMTGNATEAEDLVQDSFLKIWQKPDVWKEERGAKFTTWFYRIMINANIDRMRKRKNMASDNSVIEFMADARPGADAQMAEAQEQRMLENGINALPERQKTALTLCFYEGLSNTDAADAMGVKLKALESLLMRAKTGLRDYMNRNDNHLAKGDKYATR